MTPPDAPGAPQAEQPAPLYRWEPSASITPAPVIPSSHDATAARRREGGLLGGLAAAVGVFLKYGLVLLKLGKLGPTLISMVVALFFYTLFFGWQFGAGVVLLILVHETGHVVVSRTQGIPMSLPVFLGPFGAFTRTRRPFEDARQEAIIAIGGPVFGTAASLLCFVWALALPAGTFHYLLLALAYFGCFMNLFNLIPMSPLDGGRIANAISKWMNVLGIAVMVVVALWLSNPFAWIVLVLGVITTVQRFRNARRGIEPAAAAPRTRLAIGSAWVAMLVICVAGMSLAHTAIVTSNTVPGVTQSSGSL